MKITFLVVMMTCASLASAQTWTPPRTPDGHPDLQGIWTNASITPLERPRELGAKEYFTEAEAAENRKRALVPASVTQRSGTEAHYEFTQFGLDRTQAQVAFSLRTSMIVGPDGRVPPLTPEAQQKIADRAAKAKGHEFDGPESRGIQERCIVWGNEGPPMLPPGYNSYLQIVQTPRYVAIVQEMIHDARIIPLDGRPHLPQTIRGWLGDSRGRWEGDTLVVDTTNFTDKTNFRGSRENLHVVERFTRVDDNTIRYEFTVDDPTTWTKPWSAELPLAKDKGPIYEYACHEANYGIANNLKGARAVEKAAEETAKKEKKQPER
ncbi:MAG: hypothetical protein AUH43_16415 [Acidobacteria bacterium 13_1_40CM_65_14]|nr:MAG: hypothetical protein AUH43_16415 [Acidobacteria bacterium 13_1_40CM_65_14]